MTRSLLAAAAIVLAACSTNPPPSAMPSCAGNRVLIVTNGGDEAVNVYAVNGRTTTEIGTVPQGKKDIVVPSNVRATSFYAVAISRLAIAGSAVSATTDTRVTFVEECRPK
jgi:hypothetical protein